MHAALAIRMGVPIYGIVEHVSTAMDKIGRSVPAPGQGILTTAREMPLKFPSPVIIIKQTFFTFSLSFFLWFIMIN